LSDVESVEDGTQSAQKILSCIARTEESFGVGHIVDVLTGADTEMVRRNRHEQLSTYGLLRELPKKQVQSMVYQLLDQGLLERTAGDRPILKLNDASWEVLRGRREVKMMRPKTEAPAKAKADAESWEGVDRGLFEALRRWRLETARQRQVPAYVVLDDAALRSLARIRPTQPEALRQVRGIGEKRMADFGESVLEIIRTHCSQQQLSTDQADETALPAYVKPKQPSAIKTEAFEMFRKGRSVEDVKHLIKRARSTVSGYLVEYIAQEKPRRIDTWVDKATYQKVLQAAEAQEERLLSPIFQGLDGRVPYDTIRLVLAHLEAMQGEAPTADDHSPK
jgi:ATP-dependent DNA helicase RecQ